MMATHGFVRAALDNDRADVAVFVGYVPPRSRSPNGRVAAVTLLLQKDSVLVTSYVMASGAPAAVLRQVRVDREALAAACPPKAVLQALREMCSHPDFPCRRVGFIGSEAASAHPLVTVLGMLEMAGGVPEVLHVSTTFASLDSPELQTSGAEFWLRAHGAEPP
jgi:hypothetical protein